MISVVIPTWRRPEVLSRCLAAMGWQTMLPGQVVVTIRRDDAVTWAAIGAAEKQLEAEGVRLESVAVEPGPLTSAMNAGLARTTGDLVALTDDDAEPRPDWLERLARAFEDPAVGGVGGRDWQSRERWDEPRVGLVSWFGRVVGNHHLGSGPARDVELLKGVNCCFLGDELRRIGFDRRLRGRGNVSHWEMSLCFAFSRAGWRLVYDPAIAVDHHIAPRQDGDINARGGFESRSFMDAVHNETLAILEHLSPVGRLAFANWAAAVGTREAPGLLQVPRLMMLGEKNVASRWAATCAGRLAGMRSYFASLAEEGEANGGGKTLLSGNQANVPASMVEKQ